MGVFIRASLAASIALVSTTPAIASNSYDVIQISDETLSLESTTFGPSATHKVRIRASLFFSNLMSSVSEGYSKVCFTNNGTILRNIDSNRSSSGAWDSSTGCLIPNSSALFGSLTSIDVSFPLDLFSPGANMLSMDVISQENINLSVGTNNRYSMSLNLPNLQADGQCTVVGARAGNANVGDVLSLRASGVIGHNWVWAGPALIPSPDTRLTLRPEMKFFDVYPHCELLATAELENGTHLSTESSINNLGDLKIVGEKTFVTEPPIFAFRNSSIKNLKKWTTRRIYFDSLSIGWTSPSAIKVRSKQLGKWSTWKTIQRRNDAYSVPIWIRGSIQFELKFIDENGTNRRLFKALKAK